jgi:hypothetical protein
MQLHQPAPAGSPQDDLLCRECSSPLIQALEWTRLSEDHWSVLIRCPECLSSGEIVMGQDSAHDFLLEADEATRSLRETVESLDRDIFRQSCGTFTQALRKGHILPTDF